MYRDLRPLLPSSSPRSPPPSSSSPSLSLRCVALHRRARRTWGEWSRSKRAAVVAAVVLILTWSAWESVTQPQCSLLPSSPVPQSGAEWMDPREISLLKEVLAYARPEGAESRVLQYGAGAGTFAIHKALAATIGGKMYAISSLAQCAPLPALAASHGVGRDEWELTKLRRDATGDVVSEPLYPLDHPTPIAPRLHVYCVDSPDEETVATERGWWGRLSCGCLQRCPSNMADFEDFVRTASWIASIQSEGRVSQARSKPLLREASAADLTSAAWRTAGEVFPFADPRKAIVAIHSYPPVLFDLVLLDGRARPQAGWFVFRLLRGDHARVVVHDWNAWPWYHTLLQLYSVETKQVESALVGGGGMAVLRARANTEGAMDALPAWWFNEA